MHPTHQILIGQRAVLPKILGARFDERGKRVEVTRYFQNSRSNGREYLFDILNDPVIERVNGAIGGRLANAAHHERLDVLSLDLDVNSWAFTNRIEHLLERRDTNAVGEDDLPQLERREMGYRRACARGPPPALDRRIVVYNHHSIARCMHIQLYRISAQLERLLERRDRVLRKGVMRPPV
jgi:hypothetical protein